MENDARPEAGGEKSMKERGGGGKEGKGGTRDDGAKFLRAEVTKEAKWLCILVYTKINYMHILLF